MIKNKQPKEIKQTEEMFGVPVKEMRHITKEGYVPSSIAGLIDRQLSVPEPITEPWRYYQLITSDGIAYDKQKNAKIVLDAELLRKISWRSPLHKEALLLSDEQWEKLYGDDVLYLSADKVESADGRGFVKRNNVWQPINAAVGEVWEHLSRGKDLKEFAEMVSEASGVKTYTLWLFLDRSAYASPIMRPLVVNHPSFPYFIVYGNKSLCDSYCFVNVIPETSPERCGRKQGTRGTSPYREPGLAADSAHFSGLEELLPEKLPGNKPWYKRMLE